MLTDLLRSLSKPGGPKGVILKEQDVKIRTKKTHAPAFAYFVRLLTTIIIIPYLYAMAATQINTWLFSWNQEKWPWPGISKDSYTVKNGGTHQEEWNCVSYKKVRVGDRAFFVRLGSEPRGIFASGFVASEPFPAKSRKGKEVHNVRITFDVLLDTANDPILSIDLLKVGQLARQLWTPQGSGISIRAAFTEELELLWEDFLREYHQRT